MEFIDERFWVAISFFIFIVLTYKPVTIPILKKLDARAKHIRKELHDAKSHLNNAQDFLSYNKKRQTTIKTLINEILRKSKKEEKVLAKEAATHLENLTSIRIKSMEAKIVEQEKRMKDEMVKVAVDEAFSEVKETLSNNINDNLSDSIIKQLDFKLKDFAK